MKNYDVIIIGAGSIGVPTAFYLSQKGLKVAVVEELSSEGRGQNRAAIGGLRATHSDPSKIKLCKNSIDIVKDFQQTYGIDIDWVQGGYLYPVYTEATEETLKKLLVKQKQLGLNIDWISPDKVNELCPGINNVELRGATFSPEDGSASPLKTIGAFYTLCLRNKVDFYFNNKVTSFDIDGNKITAVHTSSEILSADTIINAAGAYAKEIGMLVNIEIPVRPDSHEGGVTEPVQRFFEPMIVDIRPNEYSLNYYFYQNKEEQIVFCITPSPNIWGTDTDSTSSFLPQVIRRMIEIYPRLRNLRIRRTWRGLYPNTPDGFPIIGYTKEISNLFLAVGMCGQGFMLGPGVGKMISEILIDNSTEYNFILEQLSLYRQFEGAEVLK